MKKIVNFYLSFLDYYTTYGVSNVGTKESPGIPDCSFKTFFYVLRCYTIKNGHFFEAIKRLLEGCKLSSILGYFHRIRPNLTVKNLTEIKQEMISLIHMNIDSCLARF